MFSKYYQAHKKTPLPREILKNPIYLIACGFGTGALPFMPGTFGTLLGVLVFLCVAQISAFNYFLVMLVITVFGTWASEKLSEEIGVHDHSGINIDEVLGYLVTMMGVPSSWPYLLAGFILFRFFDIFKPWPINEIDEKYQGGWGMMLDDIIAGVYACIVLQIGMMLMANFNAHF